MTDEDRSVSFISLRRRLFMAGLIEDIDADDESLRIGLMKLLVPTIGPDALWAARQLLKPENA